MITIEQLEKNMKHQGYITGAIIQVSHDAAPVQVFSVDILYSDGKVRTNLLVSVNNDMNIPLVTVYWGDQVYDLS